MLQLKSRNIDICRISILLGKYNVKASVTNSIITLEGDISDELLSQLCCCIEIIAVRNFPTEGVFKKESIQLHSSLSRKAQTYDLVYTKVKRGEVYLCDFGEPYGSEQGLMRYAIIIQNDIGNIWSPTTIVVPCTTEKKKNLPTHCEVIFSDNNMIDFSPNKFSLKENIVMAEQIHTVDKRRLRKYLGRLTPEFMKKIEDIIEVSLQLKGSNVR